MKGLSLFPARGPMHLVGAVGVIAVVVSTSGACQVCAEDTECEGLDVCVDGACVAPSAPSSPVIRLLAPVEEVGPTFDLVLEVEFQAAEAVVSLERSDTSPGEPPVPFLPAQQTVSGDDDVVTRVVTFRGVPSLGQRFSLLARVVAGGSSTMTIPITGQDVSFGGVVVRRPRGLDAQVIENPWTDVEVEAPGPVVAWAEPLDSAAAPTPAVSLLAIGQGRSVGRIPALRGPSIVWAATTVDDVPVRCGIGRVGGPPASSPSALEVVVLSQSPNDDDQRVEVFTRVTQSDGTEFCNGRFETPVPCRLARGVDVGPEGVDAIVVDVERGSVEIAAVPRMIGGPVTVTVRVARGERHLALWGPRTILPSQGEVWVAGRVVIDDEGARALADTGPARVGFPW
jgi:hypothetical protein